MRSNKPNIVQAEFFHIGGKPDLSLNEVLGEALSRAGDALLDILGGMDPNKVKTGIKTCVRFYDTSGKLTALARRAQELETLHLEVLEQREASRGLRRWFLGRKFVRLLGEIADMEGRQRMLAAQEFEASVRSGRQVAVERFDHSFRPVQKDEAHELAESIKVSRYAWIFLFEHNELLADKNKSVMSVL